jgi:hypothetical protein
VFLVLGFTGGAALCGLGMTRLASDGRIGLAAIGAAAALIGMTMVKAGDQHTWGGVLAVGWMTVVIGLAVAVAAAGWARLDGGDVPIGVAGIVAGAAIAAQLAALGRPMVAGLLGIAAGAVVIGAAIALLAGGDVPIGVGGLLAGVAVARVGLGLVGGPAQITHQLRRLVRMPTEPPRTDDDHTAS